MVPPRNQEKVLVVVALMQSKTIDL
jgi:hypothetical protein